MARALAHSRTIAWLTLVALLWRGAAAVAVTVPCCDTVPIQTALSNSSITSVTLTNGVYSGLCDFTFGGAARNVTLFGAGATLNCVGGTYGLVFSQEGAGDRVVGPLTIANSAVVGAMLDQSNVVMQNVSFVALAGGALGLTNGQLSLSNGTVAGCGRGSVSAIAASGSTIALDTVVIQNNSRLATAAVECSPCSISLVHVDIIEYYGMTFQLDSSNISIISSTARVNWDSSFICASNGNALIRGLTVFINSSTGGSHLLDLLEDADISGLVVVSGKGSTSGAAIYCAGNLELSNSTLQLNGNGVETSTTPTVGSVVIYNVTMESMLTRSGSLAVGGGPAFVTRLFARNFETMICTTALTLEKSSFTGVIIGGAANAAAITIPDAGVVRDCIFFDMILHAASVLLIANTGQAATVEGCDFNNITILQSAYYVIFFHGRDYAIFPRISACSFEMLRINDYVIFAEASYTVTNHPIFPPRVDFVLSNLTASDIVAPSFLRVDRDWAGPCYFSALGYEDSINCDVVPSALDACPSITTLYGVSIGNSAFSDAIFSVYDTCSPFYPYSCPQTGTCFARLYFPYTRGSLAASDVHVASSTYPEAMRAARLNTTRCRFSETQSTSVIHARVWQDEGSLFERLQTGQINEDLDLCISLFPYSGYCDFLPNCRLLTQTVNATGTSVVSSSFTVGVTVAASISSRLDNLTFVGNVPSGVTVSSSVGCGPLNFDASGLLLCASGVPIFNSIVMRNNIAVGAIACIQTSGDSYTFSNWDGENNTVLANGKGISVFIRMAVPLIGDFSNVRLRGFALLGVAGATSFFNATDGFDTSGNAATMAISLTNVSVSSTLFDGVLFAYSKLQFAIDGLVISDQAHPSPPLLSGEIISAARNIRVSNSRFLDKIASLTVPRTVLNLPTISNLQMTGVISPSGLVFPGKGANFEAVSIVNCSGNMLKLSSTTGVYVSQLYLSSSSNTDNPIVSFVTGGVLRLLNSVIIGNTLSQTAASTACGIVSNEGTTNVSRLLSSDNIGPIALETISTVSQSNFTRNYGIMGASLRVRTSTITDCHFSDSHAVTQGALSAFALGGQVSISDTTFVNNRCDGVGGGLYAESSVTATLTNVIFSANTASSGGAFYANAQVTLTIADSCFVSNVAHVSGGAIYTGLPKGSTDSIMDRCTFTDNLAMGNGTTNGGGALTIFGANNPRKLVVNNTQFTNNVAQNDGGAVHAEGRVDFSDCTFDSNTAVQNGGAIYLGYNQYGMDAISATTIQQSILSHNVAMLGGGFYCSKCAMQVVDSMVTDNTVTEDGSGFYCDLNPSVTQTIILPITTVVSGNLGATQQAVCGTCGCCKETCGMNVTDPECLLAPGRSCAFQCNRGFQTFSNTAHGGAYCGADSIFEVNLPGNVIGNDPCPAKECPRYLPEIPYFANRTLTSNYTTPHTQQYVCQPGATLSYVYKPAFPYQCYAPGGNDTCVPTTPVATCYGYWDIPDAVTCVPVFCNLIDKAAADIDAGANTNCPVDKRLPVGSECSIHCDPGTSGVKGFYTCTNSTQRYVGSYTPQDRNCLPCPVGSYRGVNDDESNCVSCGRHTYTFNIASTAASDCQCLVGFVILPNNTCTDCPAGATCPGDRLPAVSAPGYYPSNGTDDALLFLPCRPYEACAGNNTCTDGYGGYLCGDCAPTYHRLAGKCLPCPVVNAWRVVIGIVGGLIACLLLMFATKPTQESERTVGFGSLTVGISFIQLVATFATVNVAWPSTSSHMYNTFSTANLNVEIVNPECTVTVNFYEKFQTTLLIPFVIAALFFFAWVIGSLFMWIKAGRPKLQAIRLRIELLAESALSGFYFFLSLAYLMLARASFSLFACPRQADGRHTLTDNPSIECSGAVWSRNAIFAVFGIIIYVFGSPALLHISYALVKRKYGPMVAENTYISNFLVKTYRREFWFWEIVSMARKLLIVVIALFAVQDPTIQVVLSCAVFFVSAILTLVFKPFAWPKHNFVEALTQLGCIIVLFCGAVAANRGPSGLSVTESTALDAVIIVTVTIVIAGVVVCFLFEVGMTIYIGKVFKKLFPKKPNPLQVDSNVTHPLAVIFVNGQTLSVNAGGGIRHHDDDLVSRREDVTPSTATSHAAVLGDFVALAGEQGLGVYNSQTGGEVWSFEPGKTITALAGSDHGMVIGLSNGHVMLWRKLEVATFVEAGVGEDVKKEADVDPASKQTPSPPGHAPPVTLEVGSDANPIKALALELGFVYTLVGTEVKKWNMQTESCLRKWELPELPEVTCLAVKGGSVAVGGTNGRVVLIREDGDIRVVLEGHRAPVTSLATARDYLISGSHDGRVMCWHLETGRYRQSMPENSDQVTCVAANDERVFWSLRSGKLHSYPLHAAWDITNVEFLLWKAQQEKCKRCKLPRALFGGEGFEADEDAQRLLHSYSRAEDGSRPAVFDELELLVQNANWSELDIEDANHVSSLIEKAAATGARPARRV